MLQVLIGGGGSSNGVWCCHALQSDRTDVVQIASKKASMLCKKTNKLIFHHVGLMEELCEIVVQFAFYL